MVTPGTLKIDDRRVLDWPAGLAVGDEVVVVARCKVRAVEVDLVDVTGYGSANPPDLIGGESTVTVWPADLVVLPEELSAAELFEAAEKIAGRP